MPKEGRPVRAPRATPYPNSEKEFEGWSLQGNGVRGKPFKVFNASGKEINNRRKNTAIRFLKTKIQKNATPNPIKNFINTGGPTAGKKQREKLAYIFTTALRNGKNIPSHILEGAANLRLWNPTNLSATSGGELETNVVRIGVQAGLNGNPIVAGNKSHIRFTSRVNGKQIDVVDFKEGRYEKDRDTGINMFNLIYENYIPQDVMPWNLREKVQNLIPRTRPTYFIKSRFDYNPLKAFTGVPLDTRGVKGVFKKPYTLNRNTVSRFASLNSTAGNWSTIVRNTEPGALFGNFAKGTYDWEPDVIYFDPSTRILHFIELKITEGKTEAFPAEAVQLAKGKKLTELILNYPGTPENRRVTVKTYFVPWKFGTNYPINFRNWKNASGNRFKNNSAKRAGISSLAQLAQTKLKNYDPILVRNKSGKQNAFPGVNVNSMTGALERLRVKRSNAIKNTLSWVNAKGIIKTWSDPQMRNGFKKILGNWTSNTKVVSMGKVEKALRDYTVDIIRRWSTGRTLETIKGYLPNYSANQIRNRYAGPSGWGTFNSNNVFHARNARMVSEAPEASRYTRNQGSQNTPTFRRQLKEVTGVWRSFANWEESLGVPRPMVRNTLDFAEKLSEGLERLGSGGGFMSGARPANMGAEARAQAEALLAQHAAFQTNNAGNNQAAIGLGEMNES